MGLTSTFLVMLIRSKKKEIDLAAVQADNDMLDVELR